MAMRWRSLLMGATCSTKGTDAISLRENKSVAIPSVGPFNPGMSTSSPMCGRGDDGPAWVAFNKVSPKIIWLTASMSRAMKWLIAFIIAMAANSIAGIWLEGDTAQMVRLALTVVMMGCGATAFFVWFRESQR